MSFRRVRTTLLTLVTCLISAPSLAAPERLVIVRHGEKQDPWQLCPVGEERAQALNERYLGAHATEPIFAPGQPAAILTLSLHTLETAQPTVHSRQIPTTNYVALPDIGKSEAQLEVQMNQQNRLAVHDLLNEPRYNGQQVLMFWEHFHTASAALEARYPGEQVTLRQLLELDQAPTTWPNSNYNYFWIIDFNSDGSIKAFNTQRQRYSDRYANLPDNAWGMPENLPVNSPCLKN